MSDAPKSAWELALEKLQKQDRERGEAGPAALSAGQKKSIAEVRARFQARLAEAEILHRSNQAKAAGDAEALQKLEEEFQIDRRRIEDQLEREVAKARGTGRGAKKK
jgi:ABC-type Na+ efflux pump permease subunit